MAIPQTLGKYQITGILGKGGMGMVYQAFDPVIERSVALKTIRKELLDDDNVADMISRFKNEARAAGRLNHPGIVAIYDYGEDGDVSFISMEYVAGCSLNEFIRLHAEIPQADAVSIMLQLLEALDYAHEQGVVHRDIKTANILLTSDGKLKITDFGIARLDSSNLTQIGTVIGTPSSMAPEQFLGQPSDRRADLFSAGTVFYEMLTGQKPFSGPAETLAAKVCFEQEAAPSSIKSALPAAFDAVSAKALAKQPEDRYATARAFSTAIQAAFERSFQSPASPIISDSTVVLTAKAVQANLAAMKARAEQATGSPASPQTTRSTLTSWQENTLHDVERQLAIHVGPMARIMVRKAASSTTSVNELYSLLASNIEGEGARRDFLGGLTRLSASALVAANNTGTSPAPDSAVRFEIPQSTQELAGRLLARELGPIATVIVRKAASQATSLHGFYNALAEKIDSPAGRQDFLKDIGSA